MVFPLFPYYVIRSYNDFILMIGINNYMMRIVLFTHS